MNEAVLERIAADGFYGAAAVARLVFGRSTRWFYRYRFTLERAEDFPKPISRIGRPRWNGQDLLDWIHRPQLAAERPAPASDNVVDIEKMLRARLRAAR